MQLTDQQIFEQTLMLCPAERTLIVPLIKSFIKEYNEFIANNSELTYQEFVDASNRSFVDRGICMLLTKRYRADKAQPCSVMNILLQNLVIANTKESQYKCGYLFPLMQNEIYKKQSVSAVIKKCLTPRVRLLKTIIKIIEENPNN